MMMENQRQTRPTSEFADRRAFERYSISLQAIMGTPQEKQRACEIRDFCLGGMLLAYAAGSEQLFTPAVGDVIAVYCTVPTPEGPHDAVFSVRVVRTDGHRAGVALLNPDLTALQYLQQFAIASRGSVAPGPEGNAPHVDLETVAAIASACSQTVETALEPLVNRTHKRIADRLFEVSKDVRDVTQQNAYFDAMSVLDRGGDEFTYTFCEAARERLQDSNPRELTRVAKTEAGPTPASLTLVDNEVLDEWLAVSDVDNTVESRHQELLNAIEQRLTHIYGTTVDKHNNPYGPALFSESFREAVDRLAIHSIAKKLCYRCFKDELLGTAGELYQSINAVLVEHGVLPDLQYKIQRSESDDASPPTQSDSVAPAASGEPDSASTASVNTSSPHGHAAGNAAARTAGDNVTATANGDQSVARPPKPAVPAPLGEPDSMPVANGVTPAPGGNTATDVGAQSAAVNGAVPAQGGQTGPDTGAAPVAGPAATAVGAVQNVTAVSQGPATKQDIFQVVQELRSMQQQLARPKATNGVNDRGEVASPQAPVSAAGTAATSGDSVPQFYSRDEVMDAVARLEVPQEKSSRAFRSPDEFRTQVLSVLEARSDDVQTKEIGAQERNVLDVSGYIFGSMFDDGLVAESVKPWLRRLELPFLRLALLDNSVFLDTSHVARQVVNTIAQLELYGEDGATTGQSHVRETIDKLVTRVANEFDGTAAVFVEILRQLQVLTRLQAEAYDQNVKDVVTACELDEASVVPDPVSVATAAEGEDSAEDHEEWLKRVQRLEEGDWLLFTSPSGEALRLRLAWIAVHTQTYVFVNLLGLKERILRADDLATLMRSGMAIPLDNAEDPAVDRAQYTMLQGLHKQLLHETTHDQLTGLVNRREFSRRLSEAVASAKEEDLRHALFFMDLDQFSVINNTCGYEAGDQLLEEVANRLSEGMDERGLLARLGSDEFGVLLEDCSMDDALEIAEELVGALHGYRFEWDDARVAVAISLGLVPVSAGSEGATQLLQSAEASCRLASEAGGNRLQVYHSGHARLSHNKEMMHWAARIDEALERDRLHLRCQRIAPLLGDRASKPHYEILLGLEDEAGNPMSPQEFIRAAECYNRMPAVDRWVVTNVFDWMREYGVNMAHLGCIAVNLSGRSINDESFTEFLIQHIENSNLPTEQICFEITETAGISNLSYGAAFIEEIRQLGCRFSLDDFGSGMSSYGYLKNLPVDYIKIDGAFVRNMEESPSDFAVVKSICEVGHFMGKQVIAEHVENESILAMLKEIGVDYGQGYAIERPTNLHDI